MQDHIKSLEKQLNDKQKTIDQLLRDNSNTVSLVKNSKQNLSFNNNCDANFGVKKVITKSPKETVTKSPKKVINQQRSANENKNKNIVLIGDSMLNGLDEKGFINHKVNIKAHSGATSDDITHYIKPIINKSPDVIILHCGTNDISHNIKSVDNFKKSMTTLKSIPLIQDLLFLTSLRVKIWMELTIKLS